MINLGMVGCGWAARSHASLIARMDGVSLRNIIAPSARVELFAREFGVMNFGHDINQLARDRSLDGLLVCVPPHVCIDVLDQLTRIGLPILVEKPVGRTSAEVSGLNRRIGTHPIVVGLQYRSGEMFRRLQHHLATGNFGHILSAYHRMHFPVESPSNHRRAWAFDPATAAGAMVEAGVHGIDLFLRLFGPAHKSTSNTTTIDGVIVAGRVTLTHEQGVNSVVDVSYFGGLHQHSGLTEVQGERGFVCLDRGCYASRRSSIIEEFDGQVTRHADTDAGGAEQLGRFTSGIRTGQFLGLPTLAEVAEALQVIESTTVSAGRPSSSSNYLSRMTCATISGRFVAVLGHCRTDRGMIADEFHTRCIRRGEVHEIVFVRQERGQRFDAVWYGGFVEFLDGGVITRGTRLEIDGKVAGTVAGFDTTHLPNHLNILVSAKEPKTGRELGLDPGSLCRFEQHQLTDK